MGLSEFAFSCLGSSWLLGAPAEIAVPVYEFSSISSFFTLIDFSLSILALPFFLAGTADFSDTIRFLSLLFKSIETDKSG